VYAHHGSRFLAFLFLLLFFILIFIFLGVAGSIFQRIGFTQTEFAIILVATLVGSFVNIPLYKVKRIARVQTFQEVRMFWVTYRVPSWGLKEVTTTIALNAGGALVPIIVSAYVLFWHPQIWLSAIVGIILTSIAVHLVARKVEGVGIVTPAFIPPIAAAIIAAIVGDGNAAMVAYVSGTLGALIGADLTNLRGIGKLGASVASIGGGGTFDGVFLTGLIAALLVLIF
jgi:uncharacterized membrane protein